MSFRAKVVCLFAVSCVVAVGARAEQTRFWKQTSFSQFEKGTAKGVAIRSDGELAPAPKFESFADPNLAYVWALRLDSHNRLYAAGGSNAKVLRFDDAGKPTTVFESSELAAQAIAFDSADNLYVGTSPDGKVYKVTPEGSQNVFFQPKTKYIWALAIDSKGAVFVATGDSGQVFVVTPDGNGKLFYQSRERHARSLAFDAKGNLLIGTEPDGLVLRVELTRKSANAPPEAGASFVLCETNKSEITSLLQDKDGNIYAASVGEKERIPPTPRFLPNPAPPPSTPLISPGTAISPTPQLPQPSSSTFVFPSVATAGVAEVVRISPDGSPETLWASRDDLVFSLGFSASAKLLLGTGNMGNLIELEGNDLYSSVANTASSQVTSLVAGPDGKIFVATANPGKIFTLGPGYETNGTFESDTFDAKIFSRWGRLRWWGENGAMQGKIAFYVRSGNTSSPRDNWSPWAGPYKDSGGEDVACPPARFVQWKIVFLNGGADAGGIPSLSWVTLAYLPKNVAPVIDDIVIQNPGIRVLSFPMPSSGPGSAAPVPLRLPRGAGGTPGTPSMQMTSTEAPRIENPTQGFEQKGFESVLWSAHDENDDDLAFAIYYRGEGEHNWRLLKDKITQRYYSWDTSTMPDGAYYLKVVASDAPSNPADQALWSERTSERWEVANTPPRIDNLRAGSGVLNTKASFEATSASGPVARAQYSLDGGDWHIIFPTGLLSDAPKESYLMELPGLSVGEHTLAVEVADSFGNTTTAKVTFAVSPHNQ